MKIVLIIGAAGSLAHYVITALKGTGNVSLTLEPETGRAISGKSIAAFVASIIENPALYSKGNVGISKPD